MSFCSIRLQLCLLSKIHPNAFRNRSIRQYGVNDQNETENIQNVKPIRRYEKSNDSYDGVPSYPNKSKIVRPIYHRESYDNPSGASPYVTSEYVLTKARFLDHCQLLKNGIDLPAKKLVHFPLNSVNFGLESFFTREILPFWWPEMKPKLRDLYPSDIIKFTMYGLHKIWKATNSASITSTISPDSWLFLTNTTFASVDLISPKNYDAFLLCMLTFLEAFDANPTKKAELVSKLRESFETFAANIAGEKQLNFYTSREFMGRIIWNLHRLGVGKPSDVALNTVVGLLAKEMLYQPKGAVNFLFKLNHVALTFISWNVNGNTFHKEFWSMWYRKSFDLYPLLVAKSHFLNWASLYCALKVMVQFDQEEEFLQIMELWLDAIRLHKTGIPVNFVENLLDELRAKYVRYPEKIDSASLAKIVCSLK